MNNPFSPSFGKEPAMLVSRLEQKRQIIDTFQAEQPSIQVYMITGVRGSGKTVMMTTIAHELQKDSSWIVVSLSPERDLLQAFAAKLYEISGFHKLFHEAKINLSAFGLGVTIDGTPPIMDIEVAITRMLERIRKEGKRVLITIDEVTSNTHMKVFAASYQLFIRENLPLYLIMTGLYENIDNLQNEDSLTFLLRAPKIRLTPLNIGMMAHFYEKEFHISADDARKMARITKGYPFAFQVLGYLCWEQKTGYEEVQADYEQYLTDYVYRKIWSELSHKDREVAAAVARVPDGKILSIRELLQMSSNEFNPYRDRLIRKELIDGSERGYVRFTLPLFDRFVLDYA